MITNRPYLSTERKWVHREIASLPTGHVSQFASQCEQVLFQLCLNHQKPELYRNGVCDLLAKFDFFDLDRVVASKLCKAKEFVTGCPRNLEVKLSTCIRKDPSWTSSLFEEGTTAETRQLQADALDNLLSSENQMTDAHANTLLSVGNRDFNQCRYCHQWTESVRSEQRRGLDEAPTQIQECSNCLKNR